MLLAVLYLLDKWLWEGKTCHRPLLPVPSFVTLMDQDINWFVASLLLGRWCLFVNFGALLPCMSLLYGPSLGGLGSLELKWNLFSLEDHLFLYLG